LKTRTARVDRFERWCQEASAEVRNLAGAIDV
jgi:hypothetical protein